MAGISEKLSPIFEKFLFPNEKITKGKTELGHVLNS
ncbi:hypothetical protein XENE109146_12985 [Xenorhabdus nematophila]